MPKRVLICFLFCDEQSDMEHAAEKCVIKSKNVHKGSGELDVLGDPLVGTIKV